MKVITATKQQVHWKCVGGLEDWLDTRIEFEIQETEKQTKLMFRHAGWREENPFFHHCSMKWATFLLSLKDYVEGRGGRAFPDDIKIEAVGM